MTNKKFLLQGFTKETHLAAIEHLFACPNPERIILSVAYVNISGVELIATRLKAAAPQVEVFTGIRNEITTRQGLERLLALGADLHVIDTGTRHVIFHPKIYYARGKHEARVVAGSANLTPGGLNNNIEASITLDLDLTNASDSNIADSIENEFSDLTKIYPEHVLRITKVSELVSLQAEGRLVDESASSPPRAIPRIKTEKTDRLPRIQLKVKPIASKIIRTKHLMPSEPQPPSGAANPKPTPTIQNLELIWRSNPLKERDLNVPSGANTNPTGSINLGKGLFETDIDHRRYFRKEVFSTLTWKLKNNSSHLEEASTKFGLIIKGVIYGEFDLRITHNTNTQSTMYKQRNAMTRLSWGPVREHVARRDLLGRTLSLYRDATNPTRFVIEID